MDTDRTFEAGTSPRGRRPEPVAEQLARYAASVPIVGGMLLLLRVPILRGFPFNGLILAVQVSSLVGGIGAGLLATALAALAAAYLHLEPLQSLAVASPVDRSRLLLFVLAATLTSLLVGSLRAAYRRADAARVEAEDALRLRDEFLSIASHELHTPLTSLQLAMQALHTGRLDGSPDAVKRAAELCDRQLKRLARLIEELLSVSRIHAGRLQLQPEPVDLAALVREVMDALRHDLARAGSRVTMDAGAPVAGTWDRFRLEQVFTNLLSNALKFGAGKPIEVAVALENGTARVVVRDHGVGIAPDRLPHIFERFARGVSAREYGGLGLGLFIVDQIVCAHGGAVRVESMLGEGSTFTVELPRASRPAASAKARA